MTSDLSPRRRTLTEEEAVAMAVAVWIATSVAPAMSERFTIALGGLAVLLVISAYLAAKMKLLVLAVALACFVLGARAQAGYEPMPSGKVTATGFVVADPRPASGIGWRIQTRLDGGRRVDLIGYGTNGFALRKMAVGERFSITGKARPADSEWEKSKHVVGSIMVENLEVIERPPLWVRVPESIRNTVLGGADRLPYEQQALYTGLVLGDDRFQSIGQRARFRAVGLSHLLAVSGQNVAFFLAIARPGLQLLGYRSRFCLTVGLLCLFVIVTRGEPSVLRATSTAGLSAWAAVTGRHRSGIRLLAIAVTLLIALDPFLVDVVGFGLSVSASAGILLLAPSFRDRLPGPLIWRETLAVTTAAQLAVTPLLLHQFGPTPLAAIPANVAVGWAAAGVMVVGLTVGTAAGLMPERLGEIMQFPNQAMLFWLDEIALRMARLSTPSLGVIEFVALICLFVVLAIVASKKIRAFVICSYVAALLLFSVPEPPAVPTELVPGAEFIPRSANRPSVLILRADVSTRVVDELLAQQIGDIDVLIAETGNRRANLIVTGIDDVLDPRVVLAPPQHSIVVGRRLTTDSVIVTGFGQISIGVPAGSDGIGSTSLVIQQDFEIQNSTLGEP